MKNLSFILIVLTLAFSSDINQIRADFQKAHLNVTNAKKFKHLVQSTTNIDPALKTAYLGASSILISKFSSSISEKYKVFKSGKKELEQAVAMAPKNIEIRLIRLLIQHKIPAFLHYNQDKEIDSKFILSHYKSTSKELKNYIQKIVKATGCMSKEQIDQLN